MQNPLNRRITRDLKNDIGKYIAIFLFMILAIGFISGFLVAGDSMIKAYDDSFEKYNIENGNFEIDKVADETIQKVAEDNNIKIYENFYVEESLKESTVRVFKIRKEVNKICIMRGELPTKSNEIALDRMYADNNKISVGDNVKLGDQLLKVTGFVALSDYSALFSDNGDTMFDSVKFGVGVMTEDGFDSYKNSVLHYNYAWKYDVEPENENEEKELADVFGTELSEETLLLKYIPRYTNQAINFTGNDLGGDQSLLEMLLYIIIGIIAFIFAVTTSNTIAKEATVIGTLRASGYKRIEIIKHYLATPLLVTLIAAVIGNVLGYTFFKNVAAGMYYGSYSLTTYVTIWNASAFIKTTAIPFVIMLVINLVILSVKLKLEPLRFLRNDLTKKKRKKAVKLPHFKFFTRFRIRIILQNMPGYLMMFIGILFANVLLLFGMMMHPLLDKYEERTLECMPAKYQYILKAPVETDTNGAEKYLVNELKTADKYEEEIVIYGISEDSQYMKLGISDGEILISDGYHEKYNVDKGDVIKLKEKYTDKIYSFVVSGYYEYPATISVFMTNNTFCEIFDIQNGGFNGYFSDEEIVDIDKSYITSVIDEVALTKTSRQLDVSMGTMFYLFNIVAVVLFMLVIFLLSKLVIEKNTNSISMTKILGYNNWEIRKLYTTSTSIMVIVFLLASLPLDRLAIKGLYHFFMMDMSGWLTFYISPTIYWQMPLIGFVSYLIIALILYKKIGKVPMDEALKNIE